jgi:hypothetical protein
MAVRGISPLTQRTGPDDIEVDPETLQIRRRPGRRATTSFGAWFVDVMEDEWTKLK